MSLRGLLLSGVIAAFVRVATAQGTDAVCTSTYNWMTNSKGQNPCLVTAYLNSVCLDDPSDAYVDQLPEDYHYSPPSDSRVNACRCSTVYYSMLSGCAACQVRTYVPWSTWITNCTGVVPITIGGYPYRIPTGTAVPAWAYLDVVSNDTFSLQNARAYAATGPAESTAVPTAPLPSTVSSRSTASQTVTFTATSAVESVPGSGLPSVSPAVTAASSSSSGKSNVGPIVGGVVGGVGGLAILIGVALWYFCFYKKREKRPASAHYAGQYTDKMDVYGQQPITTLPKTTSPPNFYNPNDPSTFPMNAPSPVASMTPTMHNPHSPPPQNGVYYPQPGAYHGVPEL